MTVSMTECDRCPWVTVHGETAPPLEPDPNDWNDFGIDNGVKLRRTPNAKPFTRPGHNVQIRRLNFARLNCIR